MSKLRKNKELRAQLQAQLDAKLLTQTFVIQAIAREGARLRGLKGIERTPPVTIPEETEGVTE